MKEVTAFFESFFGQATWLEMFAVSGSLVGMFIVSLGWFLAFIGLELDREWLLCIGLFLVAISSAVTLPTLVYYLMSKFMA